MSYLIEVDQILRQPGIIKMSRKHGCAAFLLLCFWLLGGLAGCGCLSGSKKVEPADVLAQKGMEYFEEEEYKDALQAFTSLKERYPYSRYAILAELKVADAHFYRHEYPEAVSAYEDFIQLHPKNEAIPYVLYQIGACYYEQLLTADRDQTPTHQAILAFERLLKQHPDSAYALKARGRILDCRHLLAEHELYVANFYYKSKHYGAALGRYQGLLAGYSDVISTDTLSQVKKQIFACKEQLAELPETDPNSK
jgi:outer membrane protein assembly factor BamD